MKSAPNVAPSSVWLYIQLEYCGTNSLDSARSQISYSTPLSSYPSFDASSTAYSSPEYKATGYIDAKRDTFVLDSGDIISLTRHHYALDLSRLENLSVAASISLLPKVNHLTHHLACPL